MRSSATAATCSATAATGWGPRSRRRRTASRQRSTVSARFGRRRGRIRWPSFGREEEIDRIVEELGAARIVTLTGVGGVGKTRFASEVASSLIADYDQVVFVDLSPLEIPDGIPVEVASAAGLPVDEAPERLRRADRRAIIERVATVGPTEVLNRELTRLAVGQGVQVGAEPVECRRHRLGGSSSGMLPTRRVPRPTAQSAISAS